MTRRHAIPRPTLLCTLRALLVVLALLNYAIASAGHDHDRAAAGGEGLCAICVYGTAGGALPMQHAPQPLALRAPVPDTLVPAKPSARAQRLHAIRGPPRHS